MPGGEAGECERRSRHGTGESACAARLHDHGLYVDEIDVPQAGAGEARVRVHAAGITRNELSWRTDWLPATVS